jgi:hypothetical protein
MHPLLENKIKEYSEPGIVRLIEQYFNENEAANIYLQIVQEQRLPFVIDHAAIRCLNVDERAQEFTRLGYEYKNELIEFPEQGWWAKVYRKENLPTLFIDQDYADRKGSQSPITPWTNMFGDKVLHHVAVLVKNIDQAKKALEEKGVEFSGAVIGLPGTRLRQIFTSAELRNGTAFTVLELTERNHYDGFYPEQADGLMKSSTKIKSR